MGKFGNAYARVLAGGSASHTWISLHRLVEAFCRTTGRGFDEVFRELELAFDFSRSNSRRWPDLAVMAAAATALHTERRRVLSARERLRAGDAAARAELRAFDARVREYVASVPNVGAWGWRRRRLRGGQER